MKEIISINQDNFDARENSITKLVTNTLEGHHNPLEVFLFIKKLEATIKGAIDLLKDGATDAACTYGKGDHIVNGTTINVRSSAGRWVFSDKVKEAEKALKALKQNEKDAYHNPDLVLVDEATGEQVEAATFFGGQDVVSVRISK